MRGKIIADKASIGSYQMRARGKDVVIVDGEIERSLQFVNERRQIFFVTQDMMDVKASRFAIPQDLDKGVELFRRIEDKFRGKAAVSWKKADKAVVTGSELDELRLSAYAIDQVAQMSFCSSSAIMADKNDYRRT